LERIEVPLIEVENVGSGYREKEAVSVARFEVAPGEIIALIGPNGAGTSTFLMVLAGLLRVWRGVIRVDRKPLVFCSPQVALCCGIVLLPQGHRTFGSLTALENIRIASLWAAKGSKEEERTQQVLDQWPELRPVLNRRAGVLSGGEQQMLALAMASLLMPRLLLLDEPCAGLDARGVEQCLRALETLNNRGVALVVVEHRVRQALRMSQRVYVMREGSIVHSGRSSQLVDSEAEVRRLYGGTV
jgi:branched-chain amino acid transport system ATP-binding protein